MHMNLLLIQYESVRLLTVCMWLLKYNSLSVLESLQQQEKCGQISCEFRREENSIEIPENIHLNILRADFVKRFEIG